MEVGAESTAAAAAPGQIVVIKVALDLVHAVAPEAAHLRMVVGTQAVGAAGIELAQRRQRFRRDGFVVLHWDHGRSWNG